jgi:hypothetical protein
VETDSTISTTRAREIRKRSGRIEKKTKFPKSPAEERTSDEQIELRERELKETRPDRHSYMAYTIILEKLNNLAQRVGTQIQIVSDRGSDIKKGIDC